MFANRWLYTALCLSFQLFPCSARVDSKDIKSIPVESPHRLRTHSLGAPFLDSDLQSRWFTFGGSTIIRVDQYVRLTADQPSQQGWIFSRVPLTATNWEIEVEFKIHGKGNLYGDGMAMWLTKNRAAEGPVFGSMDKFEGLGIFFDTYKNNRPGTVFPYVMAMNGDGKTSYDQANDGKANEIAGCSARGIRNSDITTKARLTYFQDSFLRLELQYKDEDKWEQCFEVSTITIPNVAYLGFSAHTGELSDNHDIIRVEANNLYSTSPEASKPGKDRVSPGKKASQYDTKSGQKQSGSWGWFFLKIVLFLIGSAGAYVGYTIWRSSKRNSRF